MCGIIACIGDKPVESILIETIKRLEYRGYDAAGIAVLSPNSGAIEVRKSCGKIRKLEEELRRRPLTPGATIGIVHTRWATHGDPNEVENAHPHLSSGGKVAVVHNGTLDDFAIRRTELEQEGYLFVSQTDTEVLPNLIDRELKRGANSPEDAVANALRYVDGAYGIAVIVEGYNQVVAARKSSPLSVGLNGQALFIASDPAALAGYADHTAEMKDGDIVTLTLGNKPAFSGQEDVERTFEALTIKPEHIGKGGYEHFMLKEIMEQPQSVEATIAGRLRGSTIRLDGLDKDVETRLSASDRISIVACGTSLYASMAGKLLIESLARIPTEVVHASEFIYNDPILGPKDAIIGVSQSGTTHDTLKAVRLAKERGSLTIAVINRVGSTIAREVGQGHGIYLHAGAEIAVASTKAFTSQVIVLTLLALKLAQARTTVNKARVQELISSIEMLPMHLKNVLLCEDEVFALARIYKDAKRIICLGRGFAVPLAYEGALKLKEIAYIDAEGYPGGELKHGPLALIEEGVPVVSLLSNDEHGKRMVSNMEEVFTRKGQNIAFVSGGMQLRTGLAAHVIRLPEVPAELLPVVAAVPLQLLAYHMGVLRGNDVDQPRNLAKSVTVE